MSNTAYHTVLVTGASGFVGSYVVRDLVQRGYEVTAVLDGGPGEEPLVMAIEDADARWSAVQFHPESILTARVGEDIIARVLRLAQG